jgi:hypothetical protein
MEVIERYVNSCIFERIQGEPKFKRLKNILPRLFEKIDKVFKQNFQKDMFISEAQIIRKYHHEFLHEKIERNFLEHLKEELEAAFSED